MSREEDGFLARWSRRKLEARAAPEPQAPPVEPEEVAPRQAPSEPEAEAAPDPDAITPEELAALPPVESIGPDTDIAGFLRKGVPAALRKAALRRVWAADPAIRDYLNPAREYAYDWNVPGGVPGSGPLLPTDNVEAMVARVFGERPRTPEPEARPGVTDRVETASAEPKPASEEPRDEAEATPENLLTDQADDAPPPSVDLAPAPAPEPVEIRRKSQDDRESPRPRRHGGAKPV